VQTLKLVASGPNIHIGYHRNQRRLNSVHMNMMRYRNKRWLYN